MGVSQNQVYHYGGVPMIMIIGFSGLHSNPPVWETTKFCAFMEGSRAAMLPITAQPWCSFPLNLLAWLELG